MLNGSQEESWFLSPLLGAFGLEHAFSIRGHIAPLVLEEWITSCPFYIKSTNIHIVHEQICSIHLNFLEGRND